MIKLSRRNLGAGALACLAVATVRRSNVEQWRVPELPLTAAAQVDLAATLPAHVRRGGTFTLDTGSAPLPEGVTLTQSGLLSVKHGLTGTTHGVVFSYDEPERFAV